jgi:hypothetical protein
MNVGAIALAVVLGFAVLGAVRDARNGVGALDPNSNPSVREDSYKSTGRGGRRGLYGGGIHRGK